MTHLIGVSQGWMRAACAVHQEERRLRRFIAEMYRASNALVLRMQLTGRARPRDGVLCYAIDLRDRLAAEMSNPPLLQRWQTTFEQLAREERELDASTDEELARDLERWGLPEEPSHQLPLSFAG